MGILRELVAMERIQITRHFENEVSIRHLAISQALKRKMSLNAISKNAGVSIETLTRAYDYTLSADYIIALIRATTRALRMVYQKQS